MSDEAGLVLDTIEDGIVSHGGDLGGWTKRDDDRLLLFDGRATLTCKVHPPSESAVGAHVHVVTTLADYPDDPLDACVMGLDDNREQALKQSAVRWVATIAGSIKSFLDDKPLCTAAPAEGNYGLPPELKAYVSPGLSIGMNGEMSAEAMRAELPWFEFFTAGCGPRRLHLAKTVVLCNIGQVKGWSREMELDGHGVSVKSRHWPADVPNDAAGYTTRFVVVETPDEQFIQSRQALDDAIEAWLRRYHEFHDADKLIDALARDGHDRAVLEDIEKFGTIAFSRTVFGPLGIDYPETFVRVRGDDIETDVPLAAQPAFNRGLAAFARLTQIVPWEHLQAAAMYNAESNVINQVADQVGKDFDFSTLKLKPSVVPDRNATNAAIDRAVAMMQGKSTTSASERKRPWWKFW